MAPTNSTRIVRQIVGLSEISNRYDVILCDIWGVVHNGLSAFPQASAALAAFRRRGGAVILVSNAPRPSEPIFSQLSKLGVTRDAFDEIVTSGDVTIGLVVDRIDEPVLHIGPARDLSLLAAAAKAAGREPERASIEGAAYALCTGLRDDTTESLESYDAELAIMARRNLLMICANPDLIIHRGTAMIPCAGALAQRYEAIGGKVIYAGKPYSPIYDRAFDLAARSLGAPVERRRLLAIGDGMRTDIAGAANAGIDALLVTQGIHRDALHGSRSSPEADPVDLGRLCSDFGLWPDAAMSALRD